MNKIIFNSVDEWRIRLRHCQYAGEIYLSAEALKALADEFVNENVSLIEDVERYETVLLVLAVNCAYHYYDDEGFWKHFCSLLKCENTIAVQTIFGDTIEKRLRMLGLLRTERTGPFRYVGAILEQCGVSLRYIVPLARIVREMRYNTGLEFIQGMSHEEFKNRLEQVFLSRYLKNFLMDIAGWQFILQVCRLLQLYEESALTLMELKELPGFQPHFWDEFLAFFEFARTKTTSTGLRFKPRLVYFEDDNCLGLQFPSPGFIKNITQPHGIAGWRYPVTKLESLELLSEIYSGQVMDTHGNVYKWRVRGWVPSGQPVIFDSMQGMIETGLVLQPGIYYLLAPVEYQPSCKILRALGQVSIEGQRKYDAFVVNLFDGDRLPGYSVEHEISRGAVQLSWIEPEKKRLKYSSDNYMDIFTGSLPEISVSDFTPIESNITGLFYDTGNGTCRIRKKQDLLQFQEEVREQIPVKGHIWLSNINRNRLFSNKRAFAELQFCLFPESNLNFYECLYNFNDEVLFSIDVLSSCNLQLEGCRNVDSRGKQWAIPVTVSIVTGMIVCGDIEAGIRVPVYRTGLYESGGRHIRYGCFSDLEKDTEFAVRGYPGEAGQIHVTGKTSPQITVQFDRNGRASVNSGKLLEMVRAGDSQVCEVVIECSDKTASTGTVLIDLSELRKRIYQDEPYVLAIEHARNLLNIITLCHRICRAPIPARSLNFLPKFCHGFDEWMVTILACANVFDKSVITVGNEEIDWVDKIKNLEIKKALLVYRQENTEITGFSKLKNTSIDTLPGVKRWRDALDLHIRFNTAEGIADTLKDWADDVIRRRGPFRSRFSNHPGGNLLSRAWRLYLEGRKDDALALIYNLDRGSEVVFDLKNILHTLLLLRLARIQAVNDMVSRVQFSTDLARFYGIIRFAMSVLSGNPLSLEEGAGIETVETLPFHNKDSKLFKNVVSLSRKKIDEVIQDCDISEDWLLLWIVFNYLKPGKERTNLASRLLRIRNTMPASPDKGAIIERLTDYIRRN